jgi:hypothetical protein
MLGVYFRKIIQYCVVFLYASRVSSLYRKNTLVSDLRNSIQINAVM